jgi:dolichol-phosphate mannosyltransferase
MMEIMQRFLAIVRGYFGKFALVGISGIIVNEGFLALFHNLLGWSLKLSSGLAIELSIINNFMLNNFWTWADRRQQNFWTKFFKYHLVTWGSSGLVNWGVLQYLNGLGFNEHLANLIGIGLGTIINFVFSHFWTFKR